MTLFRGTLVKTLKDIKEYGYIIKKGTVLEIVWADYEADYEMYKLKGECTDSQEYIATWTYPGEFEPI